MDLPTSAPMMTRVNLHTGYTMYHLFYKQPNTCNAFVQTAKATISLRGCLRWPHMLEDTFFSMARLIWNCSMSFRRFMENGYPKPRKKVLLISSSIVLKRQVIYMCRFMRIRTANQRLAMFQTATLNKDSIFGYQNLQKWDQRFRSDRIDAQSHPNVRYPNILRENRCKICFGVRCNKFGADM